MNRVSLVCRKLRLLLKARPAQHGTALCGLEWHGCLRGALRARKARFRANPWAAARTLSLALLAVLGVIGELFVVEKQLLASCKDKIGAAIYALQYPI
jgi:hypothetical protein